MIRPAMLRLPTVGGEQKDSCALRDVSTGPASPIDSNDELVTSPGA